MVRVIPVYNFLSQNTDQIDEPTATCTVNVLGQDMLLLALTSHCIKVHSLTGNKSKLLTVFPTVDMVKQLLHCDKGNYVATLEQKIDRDGLINNFVRIYVNWEICSNQNQAMRARIAGRVTPSLNRNQNSLEMIELPLNNQPTQIAACQTTGNLLVVMSNEAVIHELKVETHQLSKHKFIDFDIRPWSLKFTFQPNNIEITEEFISIRNSTNFMLFKLTNCIYDDVNSIGPIERVNCINNYQNIKFTNHNDSKEDSINDNNKSIKSSSKTIVDFTKLISNKASYIDWDQMVFDEYVSTQKNDSIQSNNFSITLPSINSHESSQNHYIQDKPSIINAPELAVTVITKSNEDNWPENFTIEYLLRLKIATNESSPDLMFKHFTCGILKPCYYRTTKNINNKSKKLSLLRSKKYNVFNGVTCLICTNQEGYLYHFSSKSTKEISGDLKYCTIYPFTCPVSHVALENTALHALTEAGLESYTLKIPDNSSTKKNDALFNSEKFDDKLIDEVEPVSLIGLRPFLGVRKLLHASKHLVLLASNSDTWTCYSLSLPNPEDVYNDILNAANNHKESSRKTYEYLLREACTVLKMAKDIIYYSSDIDYSSNINTTSRQHIDNLYKQSCALLADYYISSEYQKHWNLCIYYYKIANLDAKNVLKRQINNKSPGITTYLSDVLVNLKSGPEADAIFQQHNIIDILTNSDTDDLLKLILASPVLREYATEKLINLLINIEKNDSCLFSLVLLYTQADKQYQAEKIIETISNNFIIDSTLTNWSWLFDVANSNRGNVVPTFSEYAGILMKKKMNIFAEILGELVDRHAITLNQMIQIFLAYLPSRVGRDGKIAGMALQLFLETYLQHYYDNYPDGNHKKSLSHDESQTNDEGIAIREGFKLLVRSYLSELTQSHQQVHQIDNNKKILFGNLRSNFFDLPQLYGINCNNDNEENKNIIIRPSIVKLQALLASGHLSNECYQEIEQFLDSQSIDGSLSFKILCCKNTKIAMQLLTDNCPKLLLEYAKVLITFNKQFEYLIAKKIFTCIFR